MCSQRDGKVLRVKAESGTRKKKKKFTPLSRNVQHKKGIIAELSQSVMQILSAVLGEES